MDDKNPMDHEKEATKVAASVDDVGLFDWHCADLTDIRTSD